MALSMRGTPMVEARIRAAWQAQLAITAKTPGLLPLLVRQRAELLPRFAAAYTQLQALPRGLRRALQRRWKESLAGLALWLALGQSPALAATIPVTARCSLVNAINAANTDTAVGGCPAGSGADTIVLPANSVQTLSAVNNNTYGPTGLPVISSKVTITGQGGTIRRASGAPEFRIAAVSLGGDLTLQETTISGGVAVGDFNYGFGGGVFTYGGTLTIMNSTIAGNTADSGGGVGAREFGSVTVTNSTITGNTADSGGGVSASSHTSVFFTLTNSTITGNTAFDCGGGVRAFGYGNIFRVTNSTITGNTAHSGGGVCNHDTELVVTNSTISGNTADFGGGVDNGTSDTSLVFEGNTITGNTALISGGGVFNHGDLFLDSTLVSGNTAPAGPEFFNQTSFGRVFNIKGYNLFGLDGNAGVSGFYLGSTDVVPGQGVLLPNILNPTLADNGGPTPTHALVPGSPALNVIPPSAGCPATDQRGVPRPQGPGCDIGAFERKSGGRP